MKAEVKKVGGSLLLHIPPDEAKRLALQPGDVVDVSVHKGGMTGEGMRRIVQKHPWLQESSLDDVLKDIREMRRDRF